MVEASGASGEPHAVPTTIAALLAEYRDRTGASYDEMSRSVSRAITPAWFQKLTTEPPKAFPRDPQTVQQLADLLQVQVPTILNAFAVSLGLDVPERQPLLAITLPPGTDKLTDRDRAAVRAMVSQLVEARRAAEHPVEPPDFAEVEGLRLADETSSPASARRKR